MFNLNTRLTVFAHKPWFSTLHMDLSSIFFSNLLLTLLHRWGGSGSGDLSVPIWYPSLSPPQNKRTAPKILNESHALSKFSLEDSGAFKNHSCLLRLSV